MEREIEDLAARQLRIETLFDEKEAAIDAALEKIRAFDAFLAGHLGNTP